MIDLIIKLTLSFFLSGFLFFPMTNSEKAKTNNFDKNGKKTGKWIYFGKDIPEAKYPDNSLVMEGDYLNGKKEGTWIKYHKDGKTPLLVGDYQKNKPHGSFKKYNQKGLLIEQGSFVEGKYDGTISKFYNNGILKYKGEFHQGIENGEISLFDQQGNIELTYSSYNGVVSKESKKNEISNNEVLKKIGVKAPEKKEEQQENLAPLLINPIVKSGTFNPNGYNKVYNDKDDILQDGIFKEGRLYDGKLYQYDADGILFKVRVYKEGIYVSDGQI